ncbi:hypothetical protein [Brevundimonas balnearis]|uniref:Uncharacterized protein n=1 Tax=Brevundimonas balnearis TaxID=1572858 RepID=A0ABV6R687_9CAUL
MRGPDRRWALLAASAALHLAILWSLALRWAEAERVPPMAPEAPILLDIAPRPLLRDERPREPSFARPTPVTAQVAAARPDAPRVRVRDEEDAAASPSIANTTTGEAVAVPRDWTVREEALGDRVARSLRNSGVGCRMRGGRMSDLEQADCDQAFGRAAARAAPITGSGDARRDARFAAEGARALAQYEARRAPLAGGVGVVGPADCVGSNFGAGCAGAHLPAVPGVDMRQGADNLVRQPSNKLD